MTVFLYPRTPDPSMAALSRPNKPRFLLPLKTLPPPTNDRRPTPPPLLVSILHPTIPTAKPLNSPRTQDLHHSHATSLHHLMPQSVTRLGPPLRHPFMPQSAKRLGPPLRHPFTPQSAKRLGPPLRHPFTPQSAKRLGPPLRHPFTPQSVTRLGPPLRQPRRQLVLRHPAMPRHHMPQPGSPVPLRFPHQFYSPCRQTTRPTRARRSPSPSHPHTSQPSHMANSRLSQGHSLGNHRQETKLHFGSQ
jgi:hypothetical protein